MECELTEKTVTTVDKTLPNVVKIVWKATRRMLQDNFPTFQTQVFG